MVFLLAAVLLPTAWQYILMARRRGLLYVVKSIAAGAALGLLAGVFIGVGARTGMSAITVANGDAPSLTLSGSFTVVYTFASFGIVLGVVYDGLFRRLLRRRGLVYGVLLMLCSWYPLAQAAGQQLTGRPALITQIMVSGVIVALMWLPFGVALEALLSRWHNRRAASAAASAAV
ncbi:MAG TPA: hypothetical protein VF240_06900 [Pyrinomonadaceae bacterium]